MIKVSIALTRRSDLSHDEFMDYWQNTHTPLLASLPSGALTVRKYVQQSRVDGSVPGSETPGWDGIAELWVDAVEDATSWFTSETYETVIAPDEANFLDRSRTTFFFSDETVVFG